MNTAQLNAWIDRQPVQPGSPAYTAVALDLARALERLQARLAQAPSPSHIATAPAPIVETSEVPGVVIDLQRPGRRGPYQRRAQKVISED